MYDVQQYLRHNSDAPQLVIKHFFLQLHTWNGRIALFPLVPMAKRLTNNMITGNDPRLGICLYYSPYFEQNILRQASSLTGEWTRKDSAFKGFRQSSSRLKEASPIAASLYKMVPEKVKQYALYRVLTGGAIKMKKVSKQPLLHKPWKKNILTHSWMPRKRIPKAERMRKQREGNA